MDDLAPFVIPEGFSADPRQLALLAAAKHIVRATGCDLVDAVRAVESRPRDVSAAPRAPLQRSESGQRSTQIATAALSRAPRAPHIGPQREEFVTVYATGGFAQLSVSARLTTRPR
jgi:hypothetical protein